MKLFAPILATAMFAALLSTASAPVRAAGAESNAVYEIVKATADRVWRLNKMTGEIAVCSLDGDNLVCASSTTAASAPTVSYEEREAEKQRAADAAAERRLREKERDLAFIDRIIAAFRLIIGAAMERESGG